MTEGNSRSVFVNLLAAFSIAVSGSMVVGAGLQNVLLYTILTAADFNQAAAGAPSGGTPVIGSLVGNHIHLFSMAILLLAAVTLVSSIGLLRRRNWARWCFIAVLAFAILSLFSGLVLQIIGYATTASQLSAAHMVGASNMQPSSIANDLFGVLFVLAICVVFGRIIKRLTSPAIVAEFCG